jgi:hypothetical protein
MIWLFYLRRWIFEIFALKLVQVATSRVPKADRGYNSYTYAQLFIRHQIIFNIILIVVILFGQFLPYVVIAWPGF